MQSVHFHRYRARLFTHCRRPIFSRRKRGDQCRHRSAIMNPRIRNRITDKQSVDVSRHGSPARICRLGALAALCTGGLGPTRFPLADLHFGVRLRRGSQHPQKSFILARAIVGFTHHGQLHRSILCRTNRQGGRKHLHRCVLHYNGGAHPALLNCRKTTLRGTGNLGGGVSAYPEQERAGKLTYNIAPK